jgi:hypothetical protein
MHSFSGPQINKVRGGLGRTAAATITAVIIAGGVATDDLALETPVKISEPKELEAYGINAAYDANNKLQVHRAVSNFFLYAPEAQVYLYLVPRSGATNALQGLDTHLEAVMLNEATERSITMAGVILNPLEAYTPTYTNGLDAHVLTAINHAQDVAETLRAQGIYLDNVLLDGRLADNATLAGLPNLRGLNSEYASVVCFNDPLVAALEPVWAKTADVGSALGMLAVRKVSECLGSVDLATKPEGAEGVGSYPLTKGTRYTSAAITSGKLFSELSATELQALDNKGYIYAGRFEGFAGTYISDSHTCTLATDDYGYIEDNRVWNKASRLAREAMIPFTRGEVEVNPDNGQLSPTFVKYMESQVLRKLSVMSQNSEISGEPIVRIPLNQDIVATGQVSLSLQYVRKGILRKTVVNVFAINPANAS